MLTFERIEFAVKTQNKGVIDSLQHQQVNDDNWLQKLWLLEEKAESSSNDFESPENFGIEKPTSNNALLVGLCVATLNGYINSVRLCLDVISNNTLKLQFTTFALLFSI